MPKITKVLGLYDSHYPHNIDVNPFITYLSHVKPDYLILGGDNWSLDIISHWNDANFKNIGFNYIRGQLAKEAVQFKAQLKALRKASPSSKVLYLVGNHEDWIHQFTEKYPQMNDLSLESLLGLKSIKIETIPFGKYYRIGKLWFAHGHQYGGMNPAKQAVERSKKSIVIGHHHSYTVWTDFSDVIDTDKHVGILCPCYSTKAPGYGLGRPNKWTNGFFWANIKRSSGNFCWGIQVVSPKGHFITQEGVEYV